MDKKVWAALVIVGTIFAASMGVYAVFETKEAHDKDMTSQEKAVDLKLENLALKIVDEIELRHGHGRRPYTTER